jgi:polyhydroxybutyrate depolymerase
MTDVVNGELKLGGRARAFTLRLPRGMAPDALVVLLHGNHPEAGGRQMRQWTTCDADRNAPAILKCSAVSR